MTDSPFSELSDVELVERTLDNNITFLQPLIERYQDKLLRYIIRISGVSQSEAEDVLQ